MRIQSILKCSALALLIAAGTAGAHPQTTIDATLPENPTGLRGFYYWEGQGVRTLWEEANGKADGGMFADPSGTDTLGLQLHHVCYGTFSPSACPGDGSACSLDCGVTIPGPDCINCHHSVHLFTYLPWGYFAGGRWVDGTAEDCEAWGGVFVARDTLHWSYVPGQTYDTGNTEHVHLSHNRTPASQCFPAGYGKAP